jgi:hypothetical protein
MPKKKPKILTYQPATIVTLQGGQAVVRQVEVEVLPDGSVVPDQAALFLGNTPDTLKTWRKRGVGPRYVIRGRSVFYRLPWLVEYAKGREVVPAE